MKTLISSVLILCCCIPVHAKVAKVLYFNQHAIAPEVVYMYVNNQLQGEVEANLEFSDAIVFDTDGEALKIVFSPHIIPTGEALPAGLPTISVNDKWEKFLLVVVEEQSDGLLPIKPIAISANDDYFANSDFLFLNMTQNSVVGTFGEVLIDLPSYQTYVARMSEYCGEFLDVKLDYIRPEDDGKKRWMIQQGWRVLPDRKTVVFCYVPKGRVGMKYFAVQVKNM